MNRNWLKSTTAVVLVVGMATPHGAIAQSAENSTTGIQLQGSAEGNANSNANAGNLGQALGLNEEEEVQEQVQDSAEEAQEATQDTLEQAQGEAESTAEQTQEAAENSTEQAQEAAEDTAEQAQETTQDTAEQAQETAEDTAEQAQENAADTAEQAENAVEEQTGEANTAVDELRNTLEGNANAEADVNADADATADANVDADADADADAAADAGSDADVNADANANANANANADADSNANAEANANETAESDADANETAGAEADANANANANANAEVDDATVEEALEKAQQDNVEQMTPEQQAEQAANTAADTGAAALSGVGELLDRTQETVTEEQARSSSEEFDTDLSDQERINANLQRAAQAKAAADDDDDDLKQVLGAAAVGALGAYLVGQSFEGGGQVVSNTGDRIVVEDGGQYRVIRDDNALLRRPGSTVETETYSDGSTRTIIDHEDGSRVVTVRSSNGAILQRTLIRPDGQEIVLIDDTREYQQVDVTRLQQQQQAQSVDYDPGQTDQLRAALAAQGGATDRAYSLNQVRNINVVRNQVPVISLDSVNFETNSAVIQPAEAEELQALGDAMREAIEENPQQLFLVEGHTDTVGRAAYNLALSDRRAESVALALTEYFNVPASNMIVQGYGESDLKVQETGDIRANRRAAVRNITPLLNGG